MNSAQITISRTPDPREFRGRGVANWCKTLRVMESDLESLIQKNPKL